MNRGSLVLITIGCLAFGLPAAHAQQPTPNPAADAALAEGRRLYDLQEWDKAIARFKEAYTLREDAPALFNIAQSYRLKGDCANAASFYKTFKRKFPKEKNIDKVEKFITEMEACARTGVAPPDPVKPDPVKPDPVKPDPVKPDPVKPDPVKPDPVKPDPVKPDPVKPDPVVAPVGPAGPERPSDKPTGGGKGIRIAGLAGMAVGFGMVATGVYFGVKARGAANEAEDIPAGQPWRPMLQENGERFERNFKILTIGGVVVGAAGAVLFVLGTKKQRESNAVSLVPDEGGGHVVWSGRF